MKQSQTNQWSGPAWAWHQAFGAGVSLMSEACVLFPVLARYTVMLGTPEKILEHLLEMMRLDSQFTESGTAITGRRPDAVPPCALEGSPLRSR